jgi:hypothetical protein
LKYSSAGTNARTVSSDNSAGQPKRLENIEDVENKAEK